MDAKERVMAEAKELKVRMDKLDDFIVNGDGYKTLPKIQQGLLVAQSQAMNRYATILKLRLENWTA